MPLSPSRSAILLLLLVPAAACVRAPPAQTARGRAPLHLVYELSYTQKPHALSVDLTLNGPPRDFAFTMPGNVREVIASTETGDQRITVDNGIVRLPAGTRSLHYVYDLATRSDLYGGRGKPGSVLVAGRAYLIRPRNAANVTATLHGTGIDALLPWEPTAPNTWTLTGSDLVDSGFHSFGGRRCTEDIDGAKLHVALHGGARRTSDAFICAWLRDSAREVLTIRKTFPYPRITVHAVTVDSAEPSPFGMMLWSTPPSVVILVGKDAPEAAFRRDWVALHELLHTAHPSFMHQAPWLPEGLATYYTEVARMRSGRQSSAEGWHELAAGFERARAEAPDATLDDALRLLENGTYLPVYWAGAYLLLDADVAIRKATSNARSLDDVLEVLAHRGTTSSVADFGRAVDEVAGTPIWSALFERHSRGPAFAGVDELMARLRSGQDAAVRAAIENSAPNASR